MSKNAIRVASETQEIGGSDRHDALDDLQTQIQIILNDLTDVASVEMTKVTVGEMRQMAQNLSRVIMQAEALLRQT